MAARTQLFRPWSSPEGRSTRQGLMTVPTFAFALVLWPPMRRGIGFSSFMHGAGFTGSGEEYLQSLVGVEALPDGRVRVLASSTEIGQGTNTILAQIAAESLG